MTRRAPKLPDTKYTGSTVTTKKNTYPTAQLLLSTGTVITVLTPLADIAEAMTRNAILDIPLLGEELVVVHLRSDHIILAAPSESHVL